MHAIGMHPESVCKPKALHAAACLMRVYPPHCSGLKDHYVNLLEKIHPAYFTPWKTLHDIQGASNMHVSHNMPSPRMSPIEASSLKNNNAIDAINVLLK